MTPNQEQRSEIRDLGQTILRALETVAQRATSLLQSTRGSVDVLAVDTNPMTGPPRGREGIGRVRTGSRQNLERIAGEPFVARVEVEWTDERSSHRETLYVTRGPATDLVDALPDARVVSYLAPLGRIAEFAAGEEAEIDAPGQYRQAEVFQRVRLRPVYRKGQWDGLEDSFEYPTWSAALDSIRVFLEQPEETVGPADTLVPDTIGQLLDEADKRTHVREALRRQVVFRMALRDQPTLDRYQGEVFRMRINRRLVLLGPPGTGKTTTLIKRLAQKRATDGLTEAENDHLERLGLLSSMQELSSWAMFSPTELLQVYLRDAFTREGVPATPENLRTWARQRLTLGRNVLRILRTPDSGRFRLDGSVTALADRSSRRITQLQEEFETFFNEAMFQRARDAVGYLRSVGGETTTRVLDEHLAIIEAGQATSPRQLVGILDLSGLQPELQRIQDDTNAALRRMANILIRNHEGILEEMAEELPGILGQESEDDDAEEDDDPSDPINEVAARSDDRQATCAKLLMSALRSRCRSLALDRRAPGGRIGRVLKFLKDRVPAAEEIKELGERLVTVRHLRFLSVFARTLVMNAPAWFARFRRSQNVQARHYGDAVRRLIEENRLSPAEVDVIILTMLRNTRLLLESNPTHLSARSRHDWLEEIKGHYLTQVFVDEATDFSAVQLACTMEMCHPRLRSWFACGDVNQRITYEGVRSVTELQDMGNAAGAAMDIRRVKRAYRQSAKLREVTTALAVDEEGLGQTIEDPGFDDNDGVPPQLAEHCAGPDVAQWLASRIREVWSMTGGLPSIAVFVHDEEQIDALVEQLGAHVASENIPVVGCKDGRSIGDAEEVRVFDVRHVKGLEFEAVFYVGIDRLAQIVPDLFERYFFVGVSRAATYLGVTCEMVLPDAIERVRGHFETGGWVA